MLWSDESSYCKITQYRDINTTMYSSFPALVKINYNLCRVTEMYKLCTANYRTTLFTTFSVLSRINIGVREEKNSGTDNSLTDIEGNFPGNLSEGWGETKFSRLNMKT